MSRSSDAAEEAPRKPGSGGWREGAGREPKFETGRMDVRTITVPSDYWQHAKERGGKEGASGYIRKLIQEDIEREKQQRGAE